MSPDVVWWGTGVGARAARAILTPLAWLYAAAASVRNGLFRTGLLRSARPVLPTIAVGNLTVGGTGKTPVTAWIAGACVRRGQTPGIVLRGYGGDEARVHAELCPGAVIVTDPDRVRGIVRARDAGATVAVLDDAFQHRRVQRDLDLVLISASVPWPLRCLPAGPLREPVRGVSRADLVLVTCKGIEDPAADYLARARNAGARQAMAVRIVPVELRQAVPDAGGHRPLEALRGARVLAVAGIGNPGPFVATLNGVGAMVDAALFPDHAAYTAADVASLLSRAGRYDFVVCTLKDGVKLRDHWPHPGPVLWYVSQRVEPADGGHLLEQALDRVCAMRQDPPR